MLKKLKNEIFDMIFVIRGPKSLIYEKFCDHGWVPLMMCDDREDVGRRAALQILKARREFDVTKHPRKFIPPSVNFQV